jgi:uncharacterized protein (DUF1501 family)
MKRRDFIKSVATSAAVLPITVGGFSVRAFGRSPMFDALMQPAQNDDRILVLVQLIGGNDGLNTVIPLDQYEAYHNARANIAIPEADVIKVTDATGLHPRLTGLSNLYKDGKLAIVQNVGYPTPNFSHFRSVDIWTAGSEYDEYLKSGWLGRYLERIYPQYPSGYPSAEMPDPVAIQVGSVVSPVLEGTLANLGMAFTNPDSYYDINDFDQPAPKPTSAANQYIGFIRATGEQIEKFAVPVKKAAEKESIRSKRWPTVKKDTLSEQLKLVAKLIAGGLKTRVYVVSLAGFDHHSSQNIDGGVNNPQPVLLNYVSTAINAFMDDLKQNGVDDRVIGMTFSEFGRRIKSNAALGTDHGTAAPHFVFGKNVKGSIIGENPVIPENPTEEDNLPMKIDFRSIYATILREWFGADEALVKEVLFKDFKTLPIFS